MRSQRLEVYLTHLKKNKMLTWDNLCTLVGSSKSTVWRDIKELAKKGLVKVEHGGVVYADVIEETYLEDRYKMNSAQKDKIASYAAKLIQDNDRVFISAGTTTQKMIHYIQAKNIMVFTNGINIAHQVAKKRIKVIFLGGRIRRRSLASFDDIAFELLQNLTFHKSFLGTNGIALNHGFTNYNLGEAKLNREVIKNSYEAFVVADSSKFNVKTLVKFGDLEDAKILTDKKVEGYEKVISVVK